MKRLLAILLLVPSFCLGDGFFGPYVSNALSYAWPQLQTFNGGISTTTIGASGTISSTASTGSALTWTGGSLSASAPAGSLVQDAAGNLSATGYMGAMNFSGLNTAFSIGSVADAYSNGFQIYGSAGGANANSIVAVINGIGPVLRIPSSGHLLINTSTDNGTDTFQNNGSLTSVGVKTTAGFTGSTITAEVAAASYTQSVNDDYIPVNFAGTVTITMLSAASYPGKMVTIRTYQAQAVNSAASNISINGVVGTSILPATAGKWATLKSDGTNWEIIDNN